MKKKMFEGKEQRGNMRRELSEWRDDDRERRGRKCRESNCVIEKGVDKIPAREINETVEQLQPPSGRSPQDKVYINCQYSLATF